MGFKLPSTSQLRKWLEHLDIQPGINAKLLQVLKDYCSGISPEDRDCVVMWDEMSIKELVQYDKYKDKFEGIEDYGNNDRTLIPATEALVFLVSGIRRTWSFPVTYYFSQNNTVSDKLSSLVKSCIQTLHKVGFRVRAGICDMSFTNQGFYRRLGISSSSPYSFIDGKKIYFMHDTPHLIKLIRNNLMTKTFNYELSDSKPRKAQWKHILQFYRADTRRTSRMAPKLSKSHIFVKDFSKMKVKLAVQVLSHSVSAGIKTLVSLKQLPPEANDTSLFVREIDELFDLLNISKEHEITKKERSGNYLLSNLHILDNKITFLQSITFPRNSTKPDCVEGLVLTVTCIKNLLTDLKNEGYKYVLTRKIQQDALENLFSIIRMRGGWNKNPTARQFRQNFRYVFVKAFLKKPSNSNCEETQDSRETNLCLLKSLFSLDECIDEEDILLGLIDEETADNVGGVDMQSNALSCPNDFYNKTLYVDGGKEDDASNNVAIYMGTFCVKKIFKKYNCTFCKLLLSETVDVNELDHLLSVNKSYSSDFVSANFTAIAFNNVASQDTCSVFKIINQKFLDFACDTLTLSGEFICRKIEDVILKQTEIMHWVNNSECLHRIDMIRLFLRIKMFKLISDKNEKWRSPKSWSQTRRDLRNQ